MTNASTIFNGKRVAVDAMVIIKFHELLSLDKLLEWARGEMVIESKVKNEVRFSKAGLIDLNPFIENNSIIEEVIEGEEQENLFYYYISNKIGETLFHKGEAACLALAISKGYGLACDEKLVRNEFKKRCPTQICTNSWGIVSKARKIGLISEEEAEDLSKGLHYT